MSKIENEIMLLEEKILDLKLLDEEKIEILLKALNIEYDDKGQYLKEAISLCLKDMEYLKRVTKKLYPKVSKKVFVSESKLRKKIKDIVDDIKNETSEITRDIQIHVIGEFLLKDNKFSSVDLIYSLVNYVREIESPKEKRVSDILKKLAFKPGDGFSYLKEAVIICYNNHIDGKFNRKALYEEIALKYDVKPSTVNEGMIRTIKNFFNSNLSQRALQNRQEVFGSNIVQINGMSNAQVINCLVQYLNKYN